MTKFDDVPRRPQYVLACYTCFSNKHVFSTKVLNSSTGTSTYGCSLIVDFMFSNPDQSIDDGPVVSITSFRFNCTKSDLKHGLFHSKYGAYNIIYIFGFAYVGGNGIVFCNIFLQIIFRNILLKNIVSIPSHIFW